MTCQACGHPAGWHDPYGAGVVPCEWLGVDRYGRAVCACAGLERPS